MDLERFHAITGAYPKLEIAIVGDFCLDRYLEIDPEKREVSIETGLPVHNVVNVRAQPGAAGTILNNLVALGIGKIYPVGFAGEDGEGHELWKALAAKSGVRLDHFLRTDQRRTFTYCKPLVLEPNKPPVELNRLDSKNWTRTPALLQGSLMNEVLRLAKKVDAMIVLDQVDLPDTGVVTPKVLEALGNLAETQPGLPIIADSRRGLRGFPPLIFKMNAAELASLTGKEAADLEQIKDTAAALAMENRRAVFVTLAERGIVGATPSGGADHVPSLPLRGEIDIVGAGDAVSANLAAALTAGAKLREALELANAAASVVVHKLGTTGTATVGEIETVLRSAGWLTGKAKEAAK